MSRIMRSLIIKFLKHPKIIYKKIINEIKWQDGNLFESHQNTQLYIMPADLLQLIRREMINIVGIKMASKLLYYLNQISAKYIIQDAKDMGFKDEQQIYYFFGILSIFGWGFFKEFKYDPESKEGELKLKDFPHLEEPAKINIHYDLSGITACALDLIYGGHHKVEEVSCEASGAEYCSFKITNEPEPDQPKPKTIDLEEIENVDASKIEKYRDIEDLLKRISMPSIGILMLDEEFRIVIKDVISINSMINSNCDALGRKMVGGILYRCGKEVQFPFKGEFNDIKDIERFLGELSLFGWGAFEIDDSRASQNIYKVSVKNSPFILGMPKGEEPICYITGGVLHQIFEKILCRDNSSRLVVKEIKCVAKGDDICQFEIRKF
ncbi:MAG: V4R domain-containing protein [Promethearchaeota archaeon]